MAKAGPEAADAVTWRDGIQLCSTPIWCDARRTRDICVVSCAHAVGNARHGQLIATAPTLALLGPQASGTPLSVPYGRPFTLGTVRLELIPSGHGLGSAALVADVAGRRILYAGAVNPGGGGLGGGADTRECDAVVVAASYGAPRYAFPPVSEVAARMAEFAEELTAAAATAVFLVSSPSKGLDVASRLGQLLPVRPGERHALMADYSIYEAARRLRPTHPTLPRIRRHDARSPTGPILLWPIARRAALPELPRGSKRALVSGRAVDRDVVATVGAEVGFAWSNQADYRQLLAYIDGCAAESVYLTHDFAETLARELGASGKRCRVLGPPQQMSLF